MGLETTCPWCGAENAARPRRAVIRSRGGLGSTVTQVLTGVILVIYVASIAVGGMGEARGFLGALAPEPEFLRSIGLMNNADVAAGQWWRIVAAVFLHLSLMHIIFNASALWSIGRPLEDDVGPAPLWVFFFASGVAGFALGVPFDTPPTAGASGAIAGLIGATIARRRMADGDFSAPVTQLSIRFAIFTALFGLAVPGINNVAHGGGFVAGALLGAVYSWTEGRRGAAVGWRVGAFVGAGLSIATVAAMAIAGPTIQGDDVIRMDVCIRKVTTDLGRMDPGSPNTLTTKLDPCLADRAILDTDPDARVAIADVEAAARATHAALAGGMRREIEREYERLAGAQIRWRVWVKKNLNRFGLTLGGGGEP